MPKTKNCQKQKSKNYGWNPSGLIYMFQQGLSGNIFSNSSLPRLAFHIRCMATKIEPRIPCRFFHLPPFSRPNLPLFPPHLSSNDAKPCAKRTDNGKKCVNKKCIRDGKNASTRAHSGHCYCMCPVATYTTALTSDPAHFKGTNICFLDRSTSHHNI